MAQHTPETQERAPMMYTVETPGGTPDFRTHRIRRFMETVTKSSCVRFLSYFSLGFKLFQILFNLAVLYITRNRLVQGPFKLFLGVYTVFVLLQGMAFFFKHMGYLVHGRPLDFAQSAESTLFNNLLDLFTLFWYFIGFKWVQEYAGAKDESPLLYYATKMWVIYGFVVLVTPLISVLVLLLLITYVKPKMPVDEYVPGGKIKEDDANCIICLCPYTAQEKIRILPCHHHFHMSCIDEWFSVDDVCPLCKKPINPLYEIVEGVE
jgi:Ring finger domain